MARIPLLQEDDPTLTPDQLDCLSEAKLARGKLLNIHRAMANRPEAARAFQQMIRVVYRNGSTLTPKHGELAYLTATAVNNCYY
jgi:alkylhydroperoxidase family enzyme